MIRRRRWTALAIVGLLTAACSRPASVRYEERLEHVPESAAHAVHERRLRELMGSLDRLRGERLPKSLDLEIEEKRQSSAITRVVSAMADSAARIPQAIPNRLSDSERADFLVLAVALRRQTQDLAEKVSELSVEQRRTRLEEIDATCEHCHQRFRIPGRNDDAR